MDYRSKISISISIILKKGKYENQYLLFFNIRLFTIVFGAWHGVLAQYSVMREGITSTGKNVLHIRHIKLNIRELFTHPFISILDKYKHADFLYSTSIKKKSTMDYLWRQPYSTN